MIDEVSGCEFRDARLGKKSSGQLQLLGDRIGDTIPLAGQRLAKTEAASRLTSNDNADQQAKRSLVCHARPSPGWRLLGGLDGELADLDTEIDPLARTRERERHGALGQHLR
ncbi:transposase DNA-binding-containing protein [Scleromatobacter humisilvae]|uniref:transposase DNA-binding-containing protein n=1 Tax=Scleromatobacter humisilvae TaxID=2897159 RepID=UPI003B845BAD